MSADAMKLTGTACSRCGGAGYEGRRPCPQCGAIGFGAEHGAYFLFWGRRVDAFAIFLERAQRATDAVINIVLVIAFIGGLALLALRVNAVPTSDVLTAAWWRAPHPSLLAFWAGVICISMLYYRRVIAAERRQAVRYRGYKETGEPLRLPSEPQLWEAVRRLPRHARIDVSRAYAPEAIKVVNESYVTARRLKHAELLPVHLFGTLLTTNKVGTVFARLGLRFEAFQDKFVRLFQGHAVDDADTRIGTRTAAVLLEAYVEAYGRRRPAVDETDLFLSVMRADERLQEFMYDLGVDLQRIENVVQWIRVHELLVQRQKKFSSAAALRPKGPMNRAMTAVATPFLDRMSTDLTRMAVNNYLDPCIGRDREFEALFRVIEGGGKSVVLVGHPGVGKEAIIEGLAQRMVEEDVPRILQDRRLVSLDLAQIVSGATASEAQERLLGALYEVGRARNIVLVVKNVAAMVGISAGTGESLDLSRVFAGELQRGYFFAITTATPAEYTSALEGTPLGNALVKVDVPEPGVNEAIQILEAKVGYIEYKHGVYFSYDAIEAAVTLSDRYMHEQLLPEKAIEVAKEVAQAVRNRKGQGQVVTKEDAAAIVSEKTRIPLTQLTTAESEKLLNLEEHMHERMIGQEQAVRQVASAMRRARAELREGTRPIANFLFLGPTGVGKTELAKTLADQYFGSENAMVRMDMSEYQDKASIYRLIGEPTGEKGGGVLTEAIRKQPFSLLLLDELEKANPDILTLFLQVMDDGRLTDNIGRTIDFTNVILIATSNAGAQFIQDKMREGASMEAIKEGLLTEQLKGIFRPEFLNRFDDVIVFSPLTQDQIESIARLMLKKVAKRLEEKGIVFEATDEAIKELAAAGFDPLFGARPLRRVIQDRVDNAIADALLRGKLGRRDRLIYEKGGTLRVEKAREL